MNKVQKTEQFERIFMEVALEWSLSLQIVTIRSNAFFESEKEESGANMAQKRQKRECGKPANPLNSLVRPDRFERSTYGFVG